MYLTPDIVVGISFEPVYPLGTFCAKCREKDPIADAALIYVVVVVSLWPIGPRPPYLLSVVCYKIWFSSRGQGVALLVPSSETIGAAGFKRGASSWCPKVRCRDALPVVPCSMFDPRLPGAFAAGVRWALCPLNSHAVIGPSETSLAPELQSLTVLQRS